MRRRLLRLVLLSVVVPVSARAAVIAAERIEGAGGPTPTSKALRRAGSIAARSRRK